MHEPRHHARASFLETYAFQKAFCRNLTTHFRLVPRDALAFSFQASTTPVRTGTRFAASRKIHGLLPKVMPTPT